MRKAKISTLILLIFLFPISIFSYDGFTHNDITNKVEASGILNNYLKSVGFPQGSAITIFTLNVDKYWYPGPRFVDAVRSYKETYGDMFLRYVGYSSGGAETHAAIDWFTMGSIQEDSPLPARPIHHFHDPTTFLGLTDYYYMQGTSARTRAFDDMTMEFMWSSV